MTDDIAKLAEGLTKAERKWLPTFRAELFGGYAAGMSKRTLQNLIAKGFVEQIRPQSGFGLVKWRLTTLGLALRAYLKDHKP